MLIYTTNFASFKENTHKKIPLDTLTNLLQLSYLPFLFVNMIENKYLKSREKPKNESQ